MLPVVSKEQKAIILQDAMRRVQDGERLELIAKDHGVQKRTLNAWLLALGDDYLVQRQAFIDGELIEASECIDEAGEMLHHGDDVPRARAILDYARQKWNRATWYAERRDRARYGVQPVAGASGQVEININIGGVQPSGNTIDNDA